MDRMDEIAIRDDTFGCGVMTVDGEASIDMTPRTLVLCAAEPRVGAQGQMKERRVLRVRAASRVIPWHSDAAMALRSRAAARLI
jgi:hypothetical protein